MNISVTDIINQVRTMMDELEPNESDFVSEHDDSALDTIITAHITTAADFCHRNADLAMMAGDTVSINSIHKNEGSQPITLDCTDMLRFILANCANWDYPITELTEEGSPEHRIALDEFVGASSHRPCAVLCHYHTDDGKPIRLVKFLPSSTYAHIRYIKLSYIKSDDSIDIDKALKQAFIIYLAALTLDATGDHRANNLFSLAYQQLGIATNTTQA